MGVAWVGPLHRGISGLGDTAVSFPAGGGPGREVRRAPPGPATERRPGGVREPAAGRTAPAEQLSGSAARRPRDPVPRPLRTCPDVGFPVKRG